MEENKPYRCVNCGAEASALYRTYGPTVLKLTKCESCKGVVDKYIEYDPVIVMIDLVLMSKEAQRHVIYNTEFKSYWKLFIIFLILETFSLWKNDSLFNTAVNTICNFNCNSTLNDSAQFALPINITLPESWSAYCKGWSQDSDIGDLFIWEKDFYIQILSTFSGVVMFITTSHLIMTLLTLRTRRSKVCLRRVLKSFSLSYCHWLSSLPALVWAVSGRRPLRAAACLYTNLVYYHVFTVLYEGPTSGTVLVLILSNFIKYVTIFLTMPVIRGFIT